MKGFKELIEACEQLGIDPNKKGENKLDDSDFYIFGDVLDFKSVPATDELSQIAGIGIILRNLFSQIPQFQSYNLAVPGGTEDQRRDSKILEICKNFQQLMIFRLQSVPGLADKKLYVHNGRIYELNRDPEVVEEEATKRTQKIIARYRDK